MSKSLVTIVQFPITPINPSFSYDLREHLRETIENPRLNDTERLWLGHTTEHATQFDIVNYKFATLKDATKNAEEFTNVIAKEVAEWLAEKGAEALADIW
jgi:hypothetical protein